MAQTPPTYVFGAAPLGSCSKENVQAFVDTLSKNGIKHIDTARAYPDSEKKLGEIGASKTFIIDTKAAGFKPNSLSRDTITASLTESLSLLNTNQIDIYYLHGPDPSTPIEETIDTLQALHRAGRFRRLGLSNFLAADVRAIHAYASAQGGVVPSVYQGNYNAFARNIEASLFPTLRDLGIAFYAYSPLAGGFFAKDPAQLARGTADGRYAQGSRGGAVYNALYTNPTTIKALGRWRDVAAAAGVSSAMLAYRWVVFHSALDGARGDAVLIGASRPGQLEETLRGLGAGPLGTEVVARVEELWGVVEAEAPSDERLLDVVMGQQ